MTNFQGSTDHRQPSLTLIIMARISTNFTENLKALKRFGTSDYTCTVNAVWQTTGDPPAYSLGRITSYILSQQGHDNIVKLDQGLQIHGSYIGLWLLIASIHSL